MQPPVMTDDSLSGVIPGIQRPPEICVDYLSHDWKKEDDIWTSWKVMSKQKKELANGIRLENASWRTWAKQKYHLKTVNPEKLNWLKDSDVTWLYGPLHTAWTPHKQEECEKPKSSSIQDKLGLIGHSPGKSCLKKKSITEQLQPTVKRHYPSLVPSHSDTQLYKKNKKKPSLKDSESIYESEEGSKPVLSTSVSESSPLHTLAEQHQNQEHHIRFNDRVEQCIAVDSAEEGDILDNDDDDDDDDDTSEDETSSSDDGAIMMKNSRKSSPLKKKKDCLTIFKLAPTKLKTDRLYSNEYSALYSNNDIGSKNSSAPSSTTTNDKTTSSSSSSSATSPTSKKSSIATYDYQPYSNYSRTPSSRWMDDDDLDDDLVDMGVFTTEMFGSFDPSTQVYGSPSKTTSPAQPPSSPLLRERSGVEDGHHDEDGDGIVDKAVHLATGVRDIMTWASGLVFNSQVF